MSTSTERPSARRSLIRSVGGSAAARLFVLPISALLGIVVTRLIIDNYGQHAYAQYMLLVGIVSLIPFADLGISAAIMNATAAAPDPRNDAHLRGTLITAMRILAGASATVILLAIVLTLCGAWPALLGDGLDGEKGQLAAGLCLVIFGLAMLVGYGQRILIGLNQNALAILIGGLQTPIVLGVLVGAIALKIDFGPYVAVASYTALIVTGTLMLILANRRIRPVLGEAFRAAWRVRRVRGDRVLDTAWPMLIQMVTVPLAMQSGRLVLSHFSSVEELARFSLASQMFTPIASVSIAASMSLWPIFARSRADGSQTTSPRTLSLWFALFASAAVLIMCLASGWLAALASGSTITLPLALVIAYGVLTVLQAAKNPLGMYMTDARGLRYQAYMAIAMLPVIVVISVVTSSAWGAVGPVVASIAAVAAFQLGANWVYVTRSERRRASALADAVAES